MPPPTKVPQKFVCWRASLFSFPFIGISAIAQGPTTWDQTIRPDGGILLTDAHLLTPYLNSIRSRPWLVSVVVVACVALALRVQESEAAGSLEEQVQEMQDLMARRPIIRLNPDKFRRLVGAQSLPRNYSIIVMMTALSPQRNCHICRQAHEEFLVVANSYRSSPHADSKKLYFGLVDYDEGSEVFNGLNINSAPCFLYFNEKGNVKSPDELNIQRLGLGADVISRWMAEKSGISVRIVRPPNLSMFAMMTALALTVAAILYMTRKSLAMILNRNVWAISAVAIVLVMTSGQMWNHIRGPPLMQRSRNQNTYILGSSSGQYVIETYLVMLMYSGIALGMVLMTDALKTGPKPDGKRRKLIARVGFCLMFLFFSLLLSIFRQKSYGYPYRLLF